ncbi:hypothetical protein OOU_Y34scaffold00255g12 [Pyricularia oryzae Y34]|uniref:Uncharacterized protein n=3 Tax=Pyricularia oryzae TaxID=318829 RepID=A0A4P7NQ95_PYROR|nr:hypothetical protein OOU_Y34scaffold00255g12 [Pyricularia oryzae Y34]QBZ64565.1 hypothetical protein PoMZ_06263 [Pyricularia oryzae]
MFSTDILAGNPNPKRLPELQARAPTPEPIMGQLRKFRGGP